jgi:L-asparaginase/Glu-tRNA(Gln) amidotransferase subunit D
MKGLNTTNGNEPDDCEARVERKTHNIRMVVCNPTIRPEGLDEATDGAEVLIFVAYATGALPDALVPVLKKRIEEGIPVVVLSNNPGDKHGITRIKYAAGIGAYEAGALPLQTVNINDIGLVHKTISEALDRGIKGQALIDYLKELFFYKKGEEPVRVR